MKEKTYCAKCGKKVEPLTTEEMRVIDKGYTLVCGNCHHPTFEVKKT